MQNVEGVIQMRNSLGVEGMRNTLRGVWGGGYSPGTILPFSQVQDHLLQQTEMKTVVLILSLLLSGNFLLKGFSFHSSTEYNLYGYSNVHLTFTSGIFPLNFFFFRPNYVKKVSSLVRDNVTARCPQINSKELRG